jgi:hypothetical protein
MPLAQGAEFRAVCRELTLNSKIWTSKLPTPENRKLVFQSPDLAPPFVLACFRHRPNRSGGRLFSLADLVYKDINFNQCVVPGWSLHAGQRRCIDGVYRHYGRQNLAQRGLTLNTVSSKNQKNNALDLIAQDRCTASADNACGRQVMSRKGDDWLPREWRSDVSGVMSNPPCGTYPCLQCRVRILGAS